MRLPIATTSLVLANVAAYGLELAGGAEDTCGAYGLVPSAPTVGSALTGMFLHVSLNHLAWNMAMLAVLGWLVERKLGPMRFVVLYFLSGFGAAAMHIFTDPTAGTLVGSSGCFFGVLAASAMLYPRLVGFACTYAAIEIGRLFLNADSSISASCHIGGFTAGFVGMLLFRHIVVD